MLYIPWRVSQTNLSLYNPCHSCRICTLCSTCHESAANWSVTVANPTSDKQKLHKADISTPCLVTFKDSKVQTRRKHAKGTRTEYPGHWGLHFWSRAWHHPNTWPMKTSNWSHMPQYALGVFVLRFTACLRRGDRCAGQVYRRWLCVFSSLPGRRNRECRLIHQGSRVSRQNG